MKNNKFEIYIVTQDYHYKDFSSANMKYFPTREKALKYINSGNLIKINDSLFYSKSNPYFYTLKTMKKSVKAIMESNDLKETMRLIDEQRNKTVDLVLKEKGVK